MKALIYDTETTGLPIWDKPSEDSCQPRITQLCAELIEDQTGEVLAALRAIIKPDGWVIPEELEKLTGITTAKAETVGARMAVVLPAFLELWKLAGHRVAHNESFDMRMVRIEMFRAQHSEADADDWKVGKAFCTCNESKKILNLPPTEKMVATGRKGPKPPNLGEAYQFFTGNPLENAHNAAVDVAACKAIYFALIRGERKAA